MALVDPSIAMGVKGIELPNQLTQYAQLAQIQGAQSANELNRFKLSAARREEDQAVSRMNALRDAGADPKQIYNALIQSGDVKGANDFMKSQRESDKSQVDLVDAKLKQSRSYLDTIDPADPNAPSMFMAWHQANHADSVLGPALEARGVTAEQSMARIQDAIQRGPAAFAQMLAQSKLGTEKFMELNKPSNTTIDQGGQKVLVQTPGMGYGAPNIVGTYADVPLPQDVEAQRTRIGKASASNISLSTEKKYGEAVAAGGGKTDLDIYDAAQAAPKNIQKIDEVLSVLRKEDINTGIGADLFNVLDKARGMVLADEKANKRAVSTEYLNSLLGSDVFPQISALNIGARGLDTPAEREFLREVLTGRIGLNKDTLIRMTELRRKGIETSVADYNQLVDSGELDPFFAARQRKKSRIDLPQPSTAPTRSVVRTGTANNRKVIEYSDGSIEYAN